MKIRQKGEYSEFELKQWGSHTEVILPIIESEDIKYMVELGAGEFSTPIYSKVCKKFLLIETESIWLEYIKTICPEKHIEYRLLEDSAILGELEREFNKEQVPDLVLVGHSYNNVKEEQRAIISNRLTKLGCRYIVIHGICKNITEKIVVHPNYDYNINKDSINPSLLIKRKI